MAEKYFDSYKQSDRSIGLFLIGLIIILALVISSIVIIVKRCRSKSRNGAMFDNKVKILSERIQENEEANKTVGEDPNESLEVSIVYGSYVDSNERKIKRATEKYLNQSNLFIFKAIN